MQAIISNIKKLFHTLKYLKFEQLWFRIFYRFKKIRVQPVYDEISTKNWYWSGPSIYKQSIFSDNSVEFLSLKGNVNSINCWNDPIKEKLWLYNLHYFDDLNSNNFSKREQIHFNFINKWILENPACIGNGWEPYPASLRLVNWVKWFSKQGEVGQMHLGSMLQQADALSQQLEYHILGNHLFANAKALTFIGCYIADKQAECYLVLGLKLLDREIPEQFLADGAHFELSPMYHEILLWDLLELIDLAHTSQNNKLMQRLPYWNKVATNALYWLKTMIHPDGEISLFNDSAIGIAAKPQQIFDYALTLGFKDTDDLPSLITNETSGYSRISSPFYTLIVDHANVGPDYLPGHAHADTLSFELSVGCERVFVNTGTSLYGLSDERHRQRGTLAHNTVTINDADSSEVWGGFRVARRAHVTNFATDISEKTIKLTAEHDGYTRLKGVGSHRREVLASNGVISINDYVSGSYDSAVAVYHLHPDIQVNAISNSRLELILVSGGIVIFNSSEPIKLEVTTYHPAFGVSMPNKRIMIPFLNNGLTVNLDIKEGH
jgi:uncharacterized heparinase superfamily protein